MQEQVYDRVTLNLFQSLPLTGSGAPYGALGVQFLRMGAETSSA